MKKKIDYTYYDEIISYYLEDFNFVSSQMQYKEDGDVISPYSFEELSSIMQEEYKDLIQTILILILQKLKRCI